MRPRLRPGNSGRNSARGNWEFWLCARKPGGQGKILIAPQATHATWPSKSEADRSEGRKGNAWRSFVITTSRGHAKIPRETEAGFVEGADGKRAPINFQRFARQ